MAYARIAVARSGAGFTVSSQTVTLAAAATFAAGTTGTAGSPAATITHVGIGRASSGAGELLFFGTVTPNIAVYTGVTPQLTTATNVAETTPDGMGNTAATNLLLLIFNNTTWANIGDATGIVGSTTAGSLYLSLHTASPAESGSQSTNETSYA